jgi:DNA-binding YbaB/EbfC family protein
MLAEFLRNADKLRELKEKAIESLSKVEAESSSGGGAVTARVNGRLQVVSVRIDPALLAAPDAEFLEDLIVAAVNGALVKAQEASARSLGSALPLSIFANPGDPGDASGAPGGL